VVFRRPHAARAAHEEERGAGVEFADHRDYTGDDFRYPRLELYQRFIALLLRLFEEEEDLAIYLIVDTSTSMGFGDARKLRYAKRVAAALALRRAREPRFA